MEDIIEDKPLFAETEQHVGDILVTSGSLLLTDGIWDSGKIHKDNKLNLDLDEENHVKIPVTTIIQNNKRYILIDIDSAIKVETQDGKIEVEDGTE